MPNAPKYYAQDNSISVGRKRLYYEYTVRLRKLISEKVILPDSTPVTITVGLSNGKLSEFDSVVKKADEYLYIGKNNGKNCIVWFKNEKEYTI